MKKKTDILWYMMVLIVLPILLIGILAYIFVPSFIKKEYCKINLLSMNSCLHVYMNDYDYKLPTMSSWCDLLVSETDLPPSTFKCPGAKEGPCNYAINANAYRYEVIPSDIVLVFEAESGWNQAGAREIASIKNHNGKGCNIMYGNFIIEFVDKDKLGNLRWE